MKKEYIQPFLQAAETIAEQYFGIPVTKSAISLDDTLALDKEVIMAIGLRGSITGIVVIGVTQVEAEKLKTQALLMQGMDEQSEFVKGLPEGEWEKIRDSSLLEFANQVTGYVTNLYEKEKIICDITTPTTLQARQLEKYKKESVRFEVKNKLSNIVMKLYIH